MKLKAIIAAMCAGAVAAFAVPFEEWYPTQPERDLPRAYAIWQSIEYPPQPAPEPTPEEIAAAAEAARVRPLQDAAAILAQTAPILSGHPATNDVPAAGMFYRLDEGDIVTLWYARQHDLLATQLYAHNAAGEEITRTVNLRTGADTTINLRKITEATKFSDLRDAKTVKTNKVQVIR